MNQQVNDTACINQEMAVMCSRLIDALRGDLGDDQQRIAETGLTWLDLLLRKNKDYGSTVFRRPHLARHCDPATGILVRMSDKIDRLTNLLSGNVSEVQ